jgi:polar amino acid transport system substrate-binding protein
MTSAKLSMAGRVEAARRALAPSGVLRAAINLGNSVLAQRNPTTGRACGVSVELSEALGHQLGADVQLVEFTAAGKVVNALQQRLWDIAFLAIDPARSTDLSFTPPYVLIEAAYLVRDESPVTMPSDVDRDGIRVGTGAGSAYDLFLTRTLRHAHIERSPTAVEALDLLASGAHDVAAGVRPVVDRYARQHGALRVVEPSFMVIRQAVALPRSADPDGAGIRFLTDFVEAMKRSGSISGALSRSGQADVAVVAPEEI